MKLKHKPWNMPKIPADPHPPWIRKNSDAPLTWGEKFELEHGPLYEHLQRGRLKDWHDAVTAYEANPEDFYAAYHWLDSHPIFYNFWNGSARRRNGKRTKELPMQERIQERYLEHEGAVAKFYVMVTKVNPGTEEVEDEDTLNTKTQVWLELGPTTWPTKRHWKNPGGTSHDHRLDCGGDTYELAVIAAARSVWERYGNDRLTVDEEDEK